jgi:hypothetical protein
MSRGLLRCDKGQLVTSYHSCVASTYNLEETSKEEKPCDTTDSSTREEVSVMTSRTLSALDGFGHLLIQLALYRKD